MALLDVSDIVCDPDFMDTGLICKRMTQIIGSNGRAENIVKPFPFGAVVCSDKGDVLERIAGGERVFGSILLHSTFILRDGGVGASADVVTWQGRDYTVVEVFNYSHFGRGFAAAKCDLLPLEG